jgi:hypothetical protein
MLYARIDLEKTNYIQMQNNWEFIKTPDINALNQIYQKYCQYKKFRSVMPIFNSVYTDPKIDVIGYFDQQELVAFSLMKKYDNENVEAIQFAWTYHNPKSRLGIISLQHECSLYKSLGFQFLYLGGADEYKKEIDGFEILKGY